MTTISFPSTPQMRVIAAGVRGNVPTLVWGGPGIAKSATLTDHGNKWGFLTKVIIGSIRDSTDFLGLPVEQNGRVTYSPPQWALEANAAEKSLIIFDEFTTSPASVMKAMLRVVQEREVGDLQLTDTVRILAIANPPDVAVDGNELAPPNANRFMHVDWSFDADTWLSDVLTNFEQTHVNSLDALTVPQTEANRARAAGLVTGYLRRNTASLNPGVPRGVDQAGRAWASPRAWTNLINVMAHIDPRDTTAQRLAVFGCVGEGEGRAFTEHLVAAGLIDPERVLADPTSVDWTNNRPDHLYALIGAVTSLVRSRGTAASWEQGMAAFTECYEQGRPDIPVTGVIDLLGSQPEGARLSARARNAFSRYVA